jgi:hypothetical protein
MPEKLTKADKMARKAAAPILEKEILFTCKFCGETKPVVDLVVMRQFFPPISSCKTCAKATRNAPGV